MSFKNHECLYDPETGEICVIIRMSDDIFAVVEFFDPEDGTDSIKIIHSAKVCHGDYDGTESRWVKFNIINPKDLEPFFSAAKNRLLKMGDIINHCRNS